MLETTEKRENGNEAELVMGVLLIIPRPAPFIARTSDLEMFAEEELLWENPDDSSLAWHPRARQEVERGQEAAKWANVDIRVINWHAPYRNETAHN